MPLIGIVSDTHGWLDPALLEHFTRCDEIWHAGDIGDPRVLHDLAECAPLRAVYGNIDDDELRGSCPLDLQFELEGLSIWITHIAGRPNRYDRRVLAQLRRAPPNVLVAGHTHILQVYRDRVHGGMVFINPGAAGRYGPHEIRTALLVEITAREIAKVQAIELGPRSGAAPGPQ